MANTHTTLNELFTDIADAIRAKNNTADTIIADDFPVEISKLKAGFDYINNTVTILPDSAFINNENINSVELGNLTSIGTSTFENCQNLQTAILPNTLTSVEENAFNDCPQLVIFCKHSNQPDTWNTDWNPDNQPVIWGDPIETWDISDSENDNVIAEIYAIDDKYTLVIRGKGKYNATKNSNSYTPWHDAGYDDNIQNVFIINGIKNIYRFSFPYCPNLNRVFIPNSVSTIGDRVFNNCTSLTEITIPKGLIEIEDGDLFLGCNNLMTINVATENPNYQSIDGHVYSKDGTIFITAARGQSNLQIAEGTKIINSGACRSYDKLTSITFPDSIETLDSLSFANCNGLTVVTLPPNLKKLYGAFEYCNNLITVNIPESVHYISDGPFAYCPKLENIIIDENNLYFKTIDGNLYDKNQTKLIQVPNAKTNITIPDGITEIGWSALCYCTKLQNFTIPDSVKTLGGYAFRDCHTLTNMTIPNGITYLPYQLFCQCTNLTTVTIPNTVKEIFYSFPSCTSLTTINFTGTMAEWNAITKDADWDDETGNYTIYCTDGNIPKAS